jgi:hypothetical protein
MPVPDAQQVASFEAKLKGAIRIAVDATAATHPGRIGYADLYPTSVPRNCHGQTGDATVAGVEISPAGNWRRPRWLHQHGHLPSDEGRPECLCARGPGRVHEPGADDSRQQPE